MSLRLALVIDGEMSGAKKALEDTATGIGKVETAAGKASRPVKDMADGLKTAASEASSAAIEIPKVGDAAEAVTGKFNGLKVAAIGAIGGLVGAIAGAAIDSVFSAASGAFTSYVDNITSSAPQVKTALDEHAALVKSIKGFWTENGDAASNYGSVSAPLLAFKTQQDILTQQETLKRLQGDALTGGALNPAFTVLPGLADFGVNDPQVGRGSVNSIGAGGTAFEEPVRKFREQLQAGTADAIAFQKEVAAIAGNLLPEDGNGRSLAQDLLGDTDAMVQVQTQLQQARDLYAGLRGDADAAATALGKSAGEAVRSGDAFAQGTVDATGFAAALKLVAEAHRLAGTYTSSDLSPALPRTPSVAGGGFREGGATGAFGSTTKPMELPL